MTPISDMLKHASQVAARSVDIDGDDSTTSNMHSWTIAVVVVALVLALVCGASAFCTIMRRKRMQRQLAQGGLPLYKTQGGSSSTLYSASSISNHKGLTIQTTNAQGRQSVLVFGRDGQPMLANPQSPPSSPDNVPEIRITFPDEHDEMGRRKSGRVVVVRVGEHNTIGMEPLREDKEQLPAYEKENKSQFYSIDMDQIGGLKEKNYKNQH